MARLRLRDIACNVLAAWALTSWLWPCVAGASPVPLLLGPGLGNGERSLEARKEAAASKAGGATSAPPRPESRAVLPEGRDVELEALRQAELTLFGRGAGRGHDDFKLPRALPPAGPSVSVSGLPFEVQRSPGDRWANLEAPGKVPWPRDLALPNLPVAFEQRTLEYLRFYKESARGRAIAEVWARKVGRYGPAMAAELARQGLPTDLVFLSLVESGHNPTITSGAGAAGLWQFIPESARAYGLSVDRWVDERLDPVRSTAAAAACLRELERRFGTWELAMAAYNMGYYGLLRAIRKYNTNDFWQLARLEAALPWETALYVPKVMAVAIVMRNKAAFGIDHVEPDPAASFETVYAPGGMALSSIAARAGVRREELAALNPQYLKSRTPPRDPDEPERRWGVHVPQGRASALSEWLREKPARPIATYRVRVGDTVESVASRLQVAESELRRENSMASWERPPPGTLLIVPEARLDSPAAAVTASTAPSAPALAGDADRVAVLPRLRYHYSERKRVFYRTLPGDTLDQLSRAFRARPADLVRWNMLDESAHLQADMLLAVYVPKGQRLDSVRFLGERDLDKRLEVGSPSFFAHFESEQGRRRIRVGAREGETLESIGKRYGLSAGMMERINHFGRQRRLRAGTPVVVYAKEGPMEGEALLSAAPEPLPPVKPPYPAVLPKPPSRSRALR